MVKKPDLIKNKRREMEKVFTMTTERLEEVLTAGKNAFMVYMKDKGYIDEKTAAKLVMNTAILARNPTFFSKMWQTFYKQPPDTSCYIVVEQQTLETEYHENGNSPATIIKLVPKKDKGDKE
jgi:hypothetical protein